MKTSTLRRGVTGHLIKVTQITELKPRETIASTTSIDSKSFSVSTMAVIVTLSPVLSQGFNLPGLIYNNPT